MVGNSYCIQENNCYNFISDRQCGCACVCVLCVCVCVCAFSDPFLTRLTDTFCHTCTLTFKMCAAAFHYTQVNKYILIIIMCSNSTQDLYLHRSKLNCVQNCEGQLILQTIVL